MDAKKVSISVGKKELATARLIAKQEGLSLSAVFVRGLHLEIAVQKRREALADLVKELPPLSSARKRELWSSWQRKANAA
jgi:hypothetical protein